MASQCQSNMFPTYQKADKLMLPVFWLLFGVSLFLATLHDTWGVAFSVGLPLAIVPTLFILTKPGRFITRSIVAVFLMLFMALHIHQAAGMTELHFGIFVILAVLLSYTDWKVIIIAAVTIAIHHLSFDILQNLAWGPICFTKPSLEIVILHAFYVVVESAMLSYLAVILNKNIRAGYELSCIVEQVTSVEGSIDLTITKGKNNRGLTKKLHEMLEHLHIILSNMKEQVSTISSSASSIAEGNYEIEQQSIVQSSHLQKAVHSVELLNQNVQKNTDNIIKANQLMLETSDNANKGGNVVNEVINTMSSIKDSSNQIVDIIGVIDSIAFQTNILALNAAVEAARAGEQGRGFAVVASEVRNLAQKSAQAAKEIKELINNSVGNVEKGNTLVKEAGIAMNNIVSSIEGVKGIMEEIKTSSQIQSSEVQETNAFLHDIEEINQQHDNLIRNASQLSSSIQEQTKLLDDDMTSLKLE